MRYKVCGQHQAQNKTKGLHAAVPVGLSKVRLASLLWPIELDSIIARVGPMGPVRGLKAAAAADAAMQTP